MTDKQKFPPRGSWRYLLQVWLYDIRVWIANRLHPLSAEQKRKNDDDLLKGGK